MTQDGQTGLAWPDHDSGPTPPPEYQSRPRDEDRTTRKPLAWWDRVKMLLVLLGIWAALLWADLAGNALLPIGDAFRLALKNSFRLGILAVAGLEVLRQIHYLISEHAAGYHRFWTKRVFGGLARRTAKTNDYNRYRVARAMKLLLFLVILDLILAKAFNAPAATALFTLPARLVSALPFVFQIGFAFFFIIFQFMGLFWFLSRGGVDVYFPDDVKTRFTDVWGQDNVLKKVKENMVFLEDPESIEEKGGYVPGGILLWGPPGTGKTLMAEAVAGETGKPFVFVDPGAFINMFMGVGILKVKGLFRKLRKLALRYGGVIVFFDEADSLGNRGAVQQGGGWGGGMMKPAALDTTPACNGMAYVSPEAASLLFRGSMPSSPDEPRGRVINRIIAGMGGMGGGGMGTLQALLSEMSGLKKPRGFFNRIVRRAIGLRPKPPPKYRILHMFATNMPQALDEAMLRPGRIDRIYTVGYPSKAGRMRTYEGYLAKVPHELTVAEIDRLATITPYATGASIKDIVNEALINAIRAGRELISWRDMVKAKQLKDLGPPEDVEYIERERHAVAVHEACHAFTAFLMRRHAVIDIATIEKGGSWLGLVAYIPPDDQFTHWRSEHEADIMCSLASLAGERLFFDGDSSSGVSQDLESATRLATLMEGYWGMGETVASHGVTHEVGIGGGGRPGKGEGKDDKLLEGSLGFRIERKLEELLGKTEQVLKENRANILALAHALEANKTITGEDVEAIIEGKPGPLIDGRPYHSSEFVEMLEAYHAQAMAAHKAHDSVKLDLPVPAKVPVFAGVHGNGEVGQRELPPGPARESGLNGEVGGNGGSPPRPDLP
jgi:cell division protease FtsH